MAGKTAKEDILRTKYVEKVIGKGVEVWRIYSRQLKVMSFELSFYVRSSLVRRYSLVFGLFAN